MKRTITAIILAITLGTFAVAAQGRFTEKYIINGKVVTDFDGSQLVGLQIESYTVDTTKIGRNFLLTHIITTNKLVINPGNTPRIYPNKNPLILLDGKKIDQKAFSLIEFKDIESINVIKDPNNELVRKYKAQDGVIVIKTKEKETNQE